MDIIVRTKRSMELDGNWSTLRIGCDFTSTDRKTSNFIVRIGENAFLIAELKAILEFAEEEYSRLLSEPPHA